MPHGRGIDFVGEKKTGFSAGTGVKNRYYWEGEEITFEEYSRRTRKRDYITCKCGIPYHKALRCPRCCIQPNLSDIAIALDKLAEQLDEIKTLLVRYDMVADEGTINIVAGEPDHGNQKEEKKESKNGSANQTDDQNKSGHEDDGGKGIDR